jgi:hypothetical protein
MEDLDLLSELFDAVSAGFYEEEEGRQLKRLAADLTLDTRMLQDALSKEF